MVCLYSVMNLLCGGFMMIYEYVVIGVIGEC